MKGSSSYTRLPSYDDIEEAPHTHSITPLIVKMGSCLSKHRDEFFLVWAIAVTFINVCLWIDLLKIGLILVNIPTFWKVFISVLTIFSLIGWAIYFYKAKITFLWMIVIGFDVYVLGILKASLWPLQTFLFLSNALLFGYTFTTKTNLIFVRDFLMGKPLSTGQESVPPRTSVQGNNDVQLNNMANSQGAPSAGVGQEGNLLS